MGRAMSKETPKAKGAVPNQVRVQKGRNLSRVSPKKVSIYPMSRRMERIMPQVNSNCYGGLYQMNEQLMGGTLSQ